jgi:hypothetical protein
MTTADDMRDVPPLPVGSMVVAAHVATLRGVPTILRIGWRWIAIVSALVVAYTATVVAVLGVIDPEGRSWVARVAPVLVEFVALVAGVAVAVRWHRHILLGEAPHGGLGIDRPFARYYAWATVSVAYTLLLDELLRGGTLFAAAVVTEEVLSDPPPGAAQLIFGVVLPLVAGVGGIVAVAVLASIPVVRLALLLPAIAVDHPVTPTMAWRRTRGMVWRLAAGILACGLVLVVGIVAVSTDARGLAPSILSRLLAFWVAVVTGMVGVTFLSDAYRHLFPEMFAPRGDGGRGEAERGP